LAVWHADRETACAPTYTHFQAVGHLRKASETEEDEEMQADIGDDT